MSNTSLSQMPEIEIALDLRQFKDRPKGANDFVSLWDDVEAALLGQRIETGQSAVLDVPELGPITIHFLHVPAELRQITAETPFAIHAVHEQPQINYACAECRKQNILRYGPFICQTCNAEVHKGGHQNRTRLCDDHAILLGGSMTAFCPTHRPRMEDGTPTTFWCVGPWCRGRMDWPEAERMRHPHDTELSYCRECFAELFPKCCISGCLKSGTNRCEFVDPQTGQSCGERLCNRHLTSWQIFGPNRRGCSHCPKHRQVRAGLSDQMLVFQIAAATTHRRAWLPSLGTVRYMFQNTRGKKYDPSVVYELFASLTGIKSQGAFWVDMKRTIEGSRWPRPKPPNPKGLILFRRLQTALHQAAQEYDKLEKVLDALEYSEYIENNNLLFVKLPEGLRGLFFGNGRREQFEEQLGCTIQFERLQD